MAKRGGKRPGAGRKKGSKDPKTIQAEILKNLLIQEVVKEKAPLIRALISKGKKGDVSALREIFDRVLGKVKEEMDLNITAKAKKLKIIQEGIQKALEKE